MRWQEAHAMALVQSERDVGQIAQNVHKTLSCALGTLGHFRGDLCGENCLDGAYQHHADHHDGEYGYRVARHVHDKQVHWYLKMIEWVNLVTWY